MALAVELKQVFAEILLYPRHILGVKATVINKLLLTFIEFTAWYGNQT